MRHAVILLLALSGLLASCGEGVGTAENCTELSNLAEQAAEDIGDDDDALERLRDQVVAKAEDLGGKALAKGANLEAALCGSIALELEPSPVTPTFESCPDGSLAVIGECP